MALVTYPPPALELHIIPDTFLAASLNQGTEIGSHHYQNLNICNEHPLLLAEDFHEELPSVERFICLLQAWDKKKDSLAYVNQLFVKACLYGFDSLGGVSNSFIDLFANCGALLSCLQVFNRLSYCDDYSWSTLIEGFLVCGQLQQACRVFETLRVTREEDHLPALMGALKACYEQGYVGCTQAIHAEIIREECEKDVFFGSALVRMYTKCGLLAEAQGVFDEIRDVDLILWNTLIGGYVDHGLFEEVMRCLREMQWLGLPPSPVTIVYGLRACVNAGCLAKGMEVCAEVFREGLEQDPFVASTLLNMFAKCGSILEAQDIFDELPYPNVVMWNTLITGYLDHDRADEVIACFSRMQSQGLPGNPITFVCILKACASTGLLALGQEIHAYIILNDYHLNAKIGNALMEMYSKCGSMYEALHVFSELAQKDVFAWTSLIAAFTECGLDDKALDCLEQMQQYCVKPNSKTYLCGLKACADAVDNGLLLHLEIVKKGFENDEYVGNALVDMYGKYGLIEETQSVFDSLPVQDIISYTSLLSRYTEFGYGKRALQLMDSMVQKGISPSVVTYLSGLGASASLRDVSKGQGIHMEIVKCGFERVQFTENTLLDMYAKCGHLEEAFRVFNELKVPCDISWNTLIMGYAEHGSSNQVLDSFRRMQSHGRCPNVATILCTLKACSNMGAIDMGHKIHTVITKQGFYLGWDVSINMPADDSVIEVASALIDMYCKCGSMHDALHVFNSVHPRQTETFNSLMTGYACQGESARVFHLLNSMQEEDKDPNEVTFLSILTVCNHDGCLDKGQTYFGIMMNAFDLHPTVKHHTCVVDLLCRAGQIDEAAVVTSTLPVQMDTVVWSSVLSAFHK